MPGVTSKIILDKVSIDNKKNIVKEELLEVLKNTNKLEVILTVGAGDIDTKVHAITQLLISKS